MFHHDIRIGPLVGRFKNGHDVGVRQPASCTRFIDQLPVLHVMLRRWFTMKSFHGDGTVNDRIMPQIDRAEGTSPQFANQVKTSNPVAGRLGSERRFRRVHGR